MYAPPMMSLLGAYTSQPAITWLVKSLALIGDVHRSFRSPHTEADLRDGADSCILS